MFASISLTEWLIIIAVIVLLFSGKKIPDFFRSLGESIREFKKAARDTNEKE